MDTVTRFFDLATGLFASVPYLLYSILSPLPALFPPFRRPMMVAFWAASILECVTVSHKNVFRAASRDGIAGVSGVVNSIVF